MRKLTMLVTALIMVAYSVAPAFSGQPSAKFSAQLSSAQLLPETSGTGWLTLLQTTIKTPNKKDLLLGGSLVTYLYTRKKRISSGDSATADAEIQVRILVDGQPAFPGVVVYDRRIETLNAVLAQVIQSCQDTGTFDPVTQTFTPGTPDGVITVEFECVATDQEIELLSRSSGARHFNFVAKDLTSGNHVVELQVRVVTLTDGDANAAAFVGKGALTVEVVQATNNPNGIVILE